jgi:hypothetical protein
MIAFILPILFYIVCEYGIYKGKKQEKKHVKELLTDKSDELRLDIIYNYYEL